MTSNNNTEVSKKIRNGLKIQQAIDSVPQRVGDVILPVFVANPDRVIQSDDASVADGTSAIIMTTHATRKTFLTDALLTVAKDVNATASFSTITANLKGKAAASIIFLRYEPLTAGQFFAAMNFNFPIELEPNTQITITHNTAIASIDGTAKIYFFETEGEE